MLKGGSLDSAVVLSDTEVLGNRLRWPDEFVRHKTGDILGDLALVGGRVQAHVVSSRPSHQGNVAVAKAIVRTTAPRGGRMLDIERIMQVLPHRYPILLVDRILELTPRKRVVGIKNVTINEPFFQGHWPGQPIMPGVLILEAMAQLAGLLLLRRLENTGKLAVLWSIDQVRFRRAVVPGDQLRIEIEATKVRSKMGQGAAVAKVGGHKVAEALLTFTLVDAT